MPVKMKRCVAAVFLCILAVSHYVEAKPAETLPNVASKSESQNSENATPPNNGKHAPGDVTATPQPVGGTTKLQAIVTTNATTTVVPTTTITTPVSNTTIANSSTPSTTQSPSSVTSSVTTTVATTTTNSTKADTTPLPTTTSSKPSVTTPVLETSTQSIPAKDRRFDGPSFIGGIVLSLGTMAIGFVAFKFYKARTERNYHTL